MRRRRPVASSLPGCSVKVPASLAGPSSVRATGSGKEAMCDLRWPSVLALARVAGRRDSVNPLRGLLAGGGGNCRENGKGEIQNRDLV